MPQTHTPPPIEPAAITPPSAAHASRMAAQSIRLCIAQKAFGDAFYIFHAVKYSNDPMFDATKQDLSAYGRDLPRYADVALQFGQAVNPRLAASALLHALLRANQPELAYRFSLKMMEAGVQFNPRSLETVIKLLSPLPNESPARHYARSMVRQYNPAVYLTMRTARFEHNAGADMALRLLEAARRSRHRRTDGMFTHLMKLCILNGELILVSMLFSALCADWKTARVLQAQVNDMLEPEEIEPTAHDCTQHAHPARDAPRPHRAQLHDILAVIDATFAREKPEPGPASALNAALQALVNLAYLLDQRLIPHADLSMFIRTLYRCPRVKVDAWVPDPGGRGGRRRVDAYAYCHSVLNRLLGNLPVRRRVDVALPRAGPRVRYPREAFEDVMVPLSVRSCNTLLHYALRHRMSVRKAERVLDYMVNRHPGKLKPDTTTLNILLRSATLLRRSDIAEQVLQMIPTGLPLSQAEKNERRVEDSVDLRPLLSHVPADKHTLTTWLTHLTATGNPAVIADSLLKILPELYLVQRSTDARALRVQRKQTDQPTRQRDLKRAAGRGPHVYVCVLNALVKAGRTGLAERVWLLARRAERASWAQARPWCLPIHAYTLMMQCYAGEARRSGVQRARDPRTGRVRWAPRAKAAVYGWARYVRGKQSARRRNAARAARLLYRAVFNARAFYGKLLRSSGRTGKVQLPEPDARFFNAALAVFLRPRREGARPVLISEHRVSPFVAGQRLHAAMRRFEDTQQPMAGCHRALTRVVADIQEAGYAIPPGLWPLLVGRMPVEGITWKGEDGVERDVPYVFPRRREGRRRQARRIEVVKTRGLPIRRKVRQRRAGQRELLVTLSPI
ncbi:hypothetical protein HDZ31DRAFT_31118 [Schizophyllum fasciatum]